ncbi:LOW QUALITY PROTEIN: hypothetical protein TMLG_03909, partial [Mycobacterium tuberculosis SUMu012]
MAAESFSVHGPGGV